MKVVCNTCLHFQSTCSWGWAGQCVLRWTGSQPGWPTNCLCLCFSHLTHWHWSSFQYGLSKHKLDMFWSVCLPTSNPPAGLRFWQRSFILSNAADSSNLVSATIYATSREAGDVGFAQSTTLAIGVALGSWKFSGFMCGHCWVFLERHLIHFWRCFCCEMEITQFI